MLPAAGASSPNNKKKHELFAQIDKNRGVYTRHLALTVLWAVNATCPPCILTKIGNYLVSENPNLRGKLRCGKYTPEILTENADDKSTDGK